MGAPNKSRHQDSKSVHSRRVEAHGPWFASRNKTKRFKLDRNGQVEAPRTLTRQEVLDRFAEIGVTKIFENENPWHGHNLRDPYFSTVPVGRIVEMRWHGYVQGLSRELKQRVDGMWQPRYVEGSADCENHNRWFQGELQQVHAAAAAAQDYEGLVTGYGVFTIDYYDRSDGNHEALAFLHHDLTFHFFKTLIGEFIDLRQEEIESIWHVSGG